MIHITKNLSIDSITELQTKKQRSHISVTPKEKNEICYQGKDDIVFLRAKGLFLLIAPLIILVL